MNDELPWDLEFHAVSVAGGLRVTAAYDAVTLRLGIALRNDGAEVALPGEVRLRSELEAPTAGGWAWLHGRFMQMDALVHNFGADVPEGYRGSYLQAREEGHRLISKEQLVVTLPVQGNPSLVVGSLRMDRFFLDIALETDADESHIEAIELVFDLSGAHIEPGETLDLPPVMLADGREALALIERYAGTVAEEMGARVPDTVPVGWCSWYFYYNRVSEADVLANLEAMRAFGHPAGVVQIDDGYQSSTGDWLRPNERFPSGMAALASRIAEAGYRPGLWLAPFVLHEDSATLRERPQMALRDTAGEHVFVDTWLGRCAVLDCTHPDSQEWLHDVFATVVGEWGYTYLKLDALAYAAQSAGRVRYHEPGTTAAANLRRGLQVIREAAGNEAFLLGCTCHFGPAIGIVDAMRVGPDVKATWADGNEPSVRHAMRMTLQRNWMHNRWWANDPDCLIVRDTDTDLDEAEVRFLATGIALSGGMVVASDDLAKLGQQRREMALALFPPSGVAAGPVEPGDGPVPFAWRTTLADGRAVLGFLNWSDTPRWVTRDQYMEPGEIAFDLWNARLLGMGDVLLRPHEGALFQVSGRGPTPRCVGDSASLGYHGLFQRQVSGQLELRNDLDRARVVAIESRGQAFAVTLAPGEHRWFQ